MSGFGKKISGILPGKKKKSRGLSGGEAPDEANGASNMVISGPTDVKHEWHVGVDPSTGNFEGMPPAWSAWLQNSNIR